MMVFDRNLKLEEGYNGCHHTTELSIGLHLMAFPYVGLQSESMHCRFSSVMLGFVSKDSAR